MAGKDEELCTEKTYAFCPCSNSSAYTFRPLYIAHEMDPMPIGRYSRKSRFLLQLFLDLCCSTFSCPEAPESLLIGIQYSPAFSAIHCHSLAIIGRFGYITKAKYCRDFI